MDRYPAWNLPAHFLIVACGQFGLKHLDIDYFGRGAPFFALGKRCVHLSHSSPLLVHKPMDPMGLGTFHHRWRHPDRSMRIHTLQLVVYNEVPARVETGDMSVSLTYKHVGALQRGSGVHYLEHAGSLG